MGQQHPAAPCQEAGAQGLPWAPVYAPNKDAILQAYCLKWGCLCCPHLAEGWLSGRGRRVFSEKIVARSLAQSTECFKDLEPHMYGTWQGKADNSQNLKEMQRNNFEGTPQIYLRNQGFPLAKHIVGQYSWPVLDRKRGREEGGGRGRREVGERREGKEEVSSPLHSPRGHLQGGCSLDLSGSCPANVPWAQTTQKMAQQERKRLFCQKSQGKIKWLISQTLIQWNFKVSQFFPVPILGTIKKSGVELQNSPLNKQFGGMGVGGERVVFLVDALLKFYKQQQKLFLKSPIPAYNHWFVVAGCAFLCKKIKACKIGLVKL